METRVGRVECSSLGNGGSRVGGVKKLRMLRLST